MNVIASNAVALFLLTLGAMTAAAAGKPFALDPSVPMDQYTLSSWRDTTGLPVDSAGAIAQTRNGYLWIATEHGLVRFDGARFTVFTTANTAALRSNEIYSLFVSSDDTLWIGTRGGGATIFNGTSFLRVPIHYRYIVGFAESGDGSIWIGAPGGITRLRGGRYEFFEKEQGYPGGQLTALAADATKVYLALPDGVMSIDGTRVRKWTARDGLAGGAVTSLLWTKHGLLAANQNGGIDRLAGERWKPFLASSSSRKPITSMIVGPGESLWMSTVGAGILRYADGKLSSLTDKDGLTGNSVNQLLEDQEGSIWAAMTGGGVVQVKAARLTTLDPVKEHAGEWILPLLRARDGGIWFATNAGGVHHVFRGSSRHYTAADGVGAGLVTALAEDNDGAIWVGTHSSLQKIANGRIVRSLTKSDGLASSEVYALTAAREGGVYVGTRAGLHHVLRDVVRTLPENDLLAKGPVISIRETADGALWLGRMLAVEHVRSGKVTRYGREQGLNPRRLTSLTIDEQDGSLWVATMGDGLYRIHDGKVREYREKDGLLTDSVYTVVQDRNGNLWIPSGRGLFNVNRFQIERFDSGQSPRITGTVFRKADGLKSSDFSGGFDRPGFRDGDGKLWFATTRGIVVVDPHGLRLDTHPPTVMIEDIMANGVRYGATPPRLGPPRGRRQLEFSYSAPAFYAPDAVAFRYKLLGYDEDWTEAGSRRTAYYTDIPAGTYEFIVEARTAEGRSGRTKTTVALAPRYYETWRFRIAAVLLLLLIVLVLHRRRVESLSRQQEKLEASEEHFRSLIENAVDMIIVVGRDGCVSYASPSVQRVLGFRSYRIHAREFCGVLVDPAAGAAFLAEVRKDGHYAAALPFRDATGNEREVEVIGAIWKNDQVILNCRDITDRRRLEAQLEQADRLASLGRLAATVSHEFNNVLMGIQPFVDLIRRRADTPNVHDSLLQIDRSIKRGKRISEEILRYTRPVAPSLRQVPAREWLSSVETEIRALIGPAARLALIAPDRMMLFADVGQLNQVLTNLAINARDAGASSVRLEVRPTEGDGVFPFGIVTDPERFAHITFSDTGCGIPADVLPKIFEPLFTTKTTRGTGLGLAVAQQVVSRHGGHLFVESKVGQGTTFHLFVPIDASEPLEVVPPAEDAHVAQGANRRFLLVEDDATVADGIILLLEDQGFTVQLAINGADALSAIPRFAPDVIILDIGLPDIDGLEVYQRIMARWPQSRVIFSTGHGDTTSIQQTLPPPHPPCLRKPYQADELAAVIAEVLESARVVA
jgi:PAS domain S-box-containing protein